MPAYPPAEYVLTAAVGDAAAAALVRLHRRELARKFWKPFAGALLLAGSTGAVLAAGLVGGVDDGVRSLLVAAFAVGCGWVGVVLGLQLLVLGMLGVAGRRVRGQLRAEYLASPDPAVRWTFRADGFTTRMGDRTRDVTWAAVRAVREADGFWIVGVTDGPELFLPAEVVADEVRALLADRAARARGGQDSAAAGEHPPSARRSPVS